MKKILLIITMLTAGFCNMWAETVTWESKEGWQAADGGFGNFKWIGVHTPENASTLYSFKELKIRFRKTGEDNVITDNYLAIARVPSESSLNANHVIAVSNNKMKAEGDNTLQTYRFDDDVVLLGGTTYYLVFVQSNTPTNGSYTVGTSRLTLNHKDYGEYMYGNSGGSTGLNYWIYFGATLTPSTATGLCTGNDLGGNMESGNWKTSWTSGTTPSFTITCPNANFNNQSDKPASGLDIRSGKAKSATYTINAPAGCLITGYKLFGKALSSNQTVTPSEGGSAVTFTTKGNSISVSGLNKTTASFTLTGDNSGLFLHAMQVSFVKSITSLPTANNKAYVITNERRTWNFADNATSMNAATNIDLNDKQQQIALIYYKENYYLYSVNAGKFLTAENTLTDIPTDNEQVSITETGNSTYPWFFRFKNINNKNINITGEGVVKIDNHTELDEGNRNAIIEAVDFNPNAVFERIYNKLIEQLEKIPWSEYRKAGQVCRYNLTSTSAFYGFVGQESAIIESCKEEGYTAKNLAEMQDFIDNNALNMPTTGYYQLKSKYNEGTGYYLSCENTNSNGNALQTTTTDENNIFYIEVGNENSTIKSYSTGYYFGEHTRANYSSVTDNPTKWTFSEGTNKGTYKLTSNVEEYTYVFPSYKLNGQILYGWSGASDKSYADRNDVATDDGHTDWILIPVAVKDKTSTEAKPAILGNITSTSDVTSNITANAKFVDLSDATIDASIDDIKAAVNGINPNAIIIAPQGTDVNEDNTSNVLVKTNTAGTYKCENLQLNDDVIAQFTTKTNFTADTKVTYTRAATGSGWGTIYLPYKPEVEEGVSYYKLTSSSESSLTFTRVDNPSANTPYMYKKESEGEMSVTNEITEIGFSLVGDYNKYEGEPDDNGYQLVGILTNSSIVESEETEAKAGYNKIKDSKAYYFKNTDHKFYSLNQRFNMKAFRCYLTTTNNSARQNVLGFSYAENGEPTGVSFIESEDGNTVDVIFDLNGRRLQNAKKGINIINGKKVIK